MSLPSSFSILFLSSTCCFFGILKSSLEEKKCERNSFKAMILHVCKTKFVLFNFKLSLILNLGGE